MNEVQLVIEMHLHSDTEDVGYQGAELRYLRNACHPSFSPHIPLSFSSSRKICCSGVHPGTTTSVIKHPTCSLLCSSVAPCKSSSGISDAFHHPPGTKS